MCSTSNQCKIHRLRQSVQLHLVVTTDPIADDVKWRENTEHILGTPGHKVENLSSMMYVTEVSLVSILCKSILAARPLKRTQTQVLGSVAEAARLVATRNIRIVHTLPGTEITALSATTAASGVGGGLGSAGVGDSSDALRDGAGGIGGGSSGGGGGGGGDGDSGGGRGVVGEATSGDQVPLFRYTDETGR